MPRGNGDRSQTVKATLGLRELVFDGVFAPGERVPEVDLAARLGVSRTPMRLALSTLAHEGLLEPLAGGGFVVRSFTQRRRVGRDRVARRARGHGGAARCRAARVARRARAARRGLAASSTTSCTTRRAEAFLRYVELNDSLPRRARRAREEPDADARRRQRRRPAVRGAGRAALVACLAAAIARDRRRGAAPASRADRRAARPPGLARRVDRPRARAPGADEPRARARGPRSTRTAARRAARAARDLNGPRGQRMSQRSLEDAIQAAGSPVDAGTQLADRPVRLPEGAGRVHELAGRAGRLARDVRAVRPVAPHDRPLRRGPGRDPAALRPGRQLVHELRRRQGQAVRRLQPRRLRDRRRDPLLPRREPRLARRAGPRRTTGCSTTARPATTTSASSATSARSSTRRASASCTASRCRARPRIEVLTKANGGPLPEIKFFNMGELTIGGHTVRALHHGMSGVARPRAVRPVGRGRGRARRARRGGRATTASVRSARASTRPTRSSPAGSPARCRPSSPATR